MNRPFELYQAIAGYGAANEIRKQADQMALKIIPYVSEISIGVIAEDGSGKYNFEVVCLHPGRVSFSFYSAFPDHVFDRKTQTFTLSPGAGRRKRTFFRISAEQIKASEPYKAWTENNNRAITERNELAIKIQDELALERLQTVPLDCSFWDYLKASPETAFEIYLNNGWQISVGIDFKNFNVGGWTLTSGPSVFTSHAEGTAVRLDYQKKIMTVYGWSSDD